MIYLRVHGKVARVVDCPRCEGEGVRTLRSGSVLLLQPDGSMSEIMTGHTWRCRCQAGKIVTYPWTRGRSLPPLIAANIHRH